MINYEKKLFKYIIIFIIFNLLILKIQTIQNFRAIYISGNYYFIVNETNIFYYSTEEGKINDYVFNDDQKINTKNEAEMISFGIFRYNSDVANCLIVKHYFYAIYENNVLCNDELSQIRGYTSEIYPFKCFDNGCCYYVVGFVNSSKILSLILYENTVPSCISNLLFTLSINLDSDIFNCQLMKPSYSEDVFTCFYQISNEIKASSYKINIDVNNNIKKIETITSLTNSKEISGLKIIKSTLSQDRTKSFVCYINNENNCECLIYDITNNVWSNNIYLNDCLLESSSIHIEYFDNKDEYILYCFQSSTKFELQKFDSNFEEKEDEENGIYDLTNSLSDCTEYYLSSLVHNSNNLKMFVSCDSNILQIIIEEAKVIPTTIITTILTTFPQQQS